MKYLILLFVFTSHSSFGQQSSTSYTHQQLENYLSQLSSMFVGRALLPAERETVKREGYPGLEKLLQSWVDGAFFIKSSRIQIQTQLGVSGNDGIIDYDLPANLLENLIRQDRPYSEILTADYCVNNSNQKVNCDSGAPFTAGILTTRAYLKQYRGRFNLSRASNMLRQFACESYPMSTKLEPRVSRNTLIPMFAEDLVDGSQTFGNGSACYSCHSQFAAHTQFFVKFDAAGVYRPTANGQQDPNLEAGRSTNDLFSSHKNTPALAETETSQMFGQSAVNLREAAVILTNNTLFSECAVRNAIRYFIRMNSGNETINTGVVKEIAGALKQKYRDPSFKQIVFESLKHPLVIGSVLLAGE